MQIDKITGTVLNIHCDTCDKIVATVTLSDNPPESFLEPIVNAAYMAHLITVDMTEGQPHGNSN